MRKLGSVNVLIFLLVMESVWGSSPPRIPFLTVLQNGETSQVYTNQSFQYSPSSFQNLEISCETEETEETVNYFWNLMDIPLSKADTDFEIINGTLLFLQSNYGMFECFASTSLGTSYSAVVLTKHELNTQSSLKLVQGPEPLKVSSASSLRFLCEAESEGDLEFSWTFNTKAVKTARSDWKIERLSRSTESLYISEVSPSDIGTVGCLVSSNSHKLYQEGSIEIIEETEPRMIAPIVRLSTENQVQVIEGESISLNCEVKGSPAPDIHWKHQNKIYLDKQFSLENVSRESSGDVICSGHNLAGRMTDSVEVQVFSHTTVDDNKEEILEFLIDGEVRLECNYNVDEKWREEIQVVWEKNGKPLSAENITVESTVGKSILQFTMISESDRGNYSCLVETPLDKVSKIWEVRLVSSPDILHFESNKIVLQGTLTTIQCHTTGIPAPKVSWLLNGTLLEETSSVHFLDSGSIRLDSLDLSQEGEYRCVATNKFGSEEKSLNLSVARPTSPIIDIESGLLEMQAGSGLDLNCSGNIDPLLESSARYSWSKDGTDIPADWISGSSSLNIPYLLKEHSGLYSCQIRTLLDQIRIETEVRIETAGPRIITPEISTLGEISGGKVSVECSATGIPAPTLVFKFKDDEYSGRIISSSINQTQSALELNNLSEKDEGEYLCLAVNEYGNSQEGMRLEVFSRTIILSGPSDIVHKSGESTTIPCKVEVDKGLRPSMKITWFRNQSPLNSSPSTIITRDSLTLRNLTKDDEGIYSCIAETRKDKTSLSGRLTVLSEAPTFSSTPRDIRILEGRDTELYCQANGIPEPTVSWMFEDGSLRSNKGVLLLSSVTPEKEGNYICTAENIYGSVSETVNLQVIKGARKENQNLIPDIVKNIKDTISLPCDFKVDQRVEEETKVIWTKDMNPIPADSSKYRIGQSRALEIKNIQLEDAGQYTCKVITPLQEVQSKISLIVSGESPEILNSFDKVSIHEGDTLSLSCVARGVPGPSIEWLVKDRPVSSQYLTNIQTANSEFKETRVIIKEATKSQEGVYQCVAKNNVGTVVKNSHVRVVKRTKVSIISGEEGRADITVPAGQKLKLPCRVENDDMNRITRILWSKDDKNIQVGGEDIIDFGMDGSITIFNVQKRNEGVYRCTVTTVRDEASAEIPLKVLVNAPVITKYSKNQMIFSGTSTILECIGTGIPEPETRWTFNKTITKVIGSTFDIKNAISADSGFYTCTARNSIGETQRTIVVSVVTVPSAQEIYQAKLGSKIKLPCVREQNKVKVLWLKDNNPLESLSEGMELDDEGYMVFSNLSQVDEGEYRCRVAIETGRIERVMKVSIMPDIVTIDNSKLEVKEGDNFTLKCDVLPGVNAKRMWKKDGQLVFPESGSGLDILQQGGVLTVEQARPSHSGEWECIASTAWGEDTILYWLSVPSRIHMKKPCSVRVPPVITEIISTSNTSVVLEWDVLNFNSSCFQEFMIFWWSKEEDSTHDNQTIELKHRKATIIGLKPDVAYYFQVNLVRDRSLKDYMYGQTKSHMMQFTEKSELSSDSNPKAVIIIVIIVIVLLLTLLVLLYIKRDRVSKFLAQRTKTRKHSEFSEFSSKLVANPDFMASLAPQWPEPEPEPLESHAFIQHQRQTSRRNSKTSITSSWSSLFNVENLSAIEMENQNHKGGSRRNNIS